MKSYNNLEIDIFDDVIIGIPNYRGFTDGIVIALTPQKVRVEYSYQNRIHNILLDPKFVIVKEA